MRLRIWTLILFTAVISTGCEGFSTSSSASSAALEDCTEDTPTTAPCKVDQPGKIVTGSVGADITSWQNAGAGTTVMTPIPDGFYSNQNVSFDVPTLLAGNILSGVSIFGVTGNVTAAYAACADNALNASQCSTSLNRYVTATAGANVNGGNGSLTATIPQGFYSGAQSCTMSDTNLLAANIRNGVTIFGQAGNLIAAYAACVDDSLNTAQCSTSANRYVTADEGQNITAGWSNATASTTITADIPDGFYSGKIISFVQATLLAANIRTGISIFGVTGSYTGTFKLNMASTMYRDPATAQISLESETVTNAGAAYTNSFTGYRAVPDITTDDDGRVGLSSVNRTAGSATGLWAARTCGLDGTISDRITSCGIEFGADATWDGSSRGNAGQGVWRLVTRTGAMSGSKGREVWQDQRTGLLWSSRVATDLNWCKASGSNNVTGNPTAQDDPSDFCDNASYQTTGSTPGDFAISACYEDPDYFTVNDINIDPLGKGGLSLSSGPEVAWRLPTRDDYLIAEVNGMRQVLPDAGENFGYWEWTATLESNNRARAWQFSTWDGALSTYLDRNGDANVRCVGR